MVAFVQDEVAKYSAAQKEQLKKVIAALSAEARLPAQRERDPRDALLIAEGQALLRGDLGCTDCHKFHGEGPAKGPQLTGYGSREWLIGLITNPAHTNYFGARNDRMPAFGAEKILDAATMGLVADWLRGEWHEPK